MGENGKNGKGDGRERRKKNLVFKGVRKVKEGSKEEIKNICKEIGVDIEIEEIRKIKTGREEKGDMLIVKIRLEENKRKILENKRKLKGRSVWIEEDLTFKERKMRWNLRRGRGGEKEGEDSEDGKWENLGRKCMVVLG